MRVGAQMLRVSSLESLREDVILRRESDTGRGVRGRRRGELEVWVVEFVGIGVSHCSVEFGDRVPVCFIVAML